MSVRNSIPAALAVEVFGNLDRVGGRTFSQVVRHNPHVQSLGVGQIPSQSAHEDLVFALRIQWHGVKFLLRLVLHHDARKGGQGSPDFLELKLPFEFDKHRLAVSSNHWHAHRVHDN